MAKNNTSRIRCNTCGVLESEIREGICDYCAGGTYCTMTEEDFIEKRLYDYAEKHHLLTHCKRDMFVPEDIRQKMESRKISSSVPKYFRDAVSCDGLTFDKLEDFPVGVVLRVCRGSSNPEYLLVGDLVWRSQPTPGYPDGLNIIQDAGMFDIDESAIALKGAHFEETYHNIPSQW